MKITAEQIRQAHGDSWGYNAQAIADSLNEQLNKPADPYPLNTPYCPNCGAKNDKATES